MRRFLAPTLVLCLGCSSGPRLYPVEGVVVYADGTPARELVGYTVEFETVEPIDGKRVSAVGTVGPDGAFRLTTVKDADGAYAGTYRVLVSPPVVGGDAPNPPRVIPDRYASFAESGLEATVGPGAPRVELKVERLRR